MKLIAQVKLHPTPQQHVALLQTLEQANALCDIISTFAWEHQIFGAFKLQKLSYHPMRAASGLTAQLVIRMFAKVADAYKLDKKRRRTFRQHGAIAYDSRILTWYTNLQRVSIWSVKGRLNIPYQCGEHQRYLLNYQQGESDLVYSPTTKEFFLLATCDLPDPDERETDEALGIDMGVTNIAVSSDGDCFTSEAIEYTRKRYLKLRSALQQRGSKSAKRHLKKLAGRQYRFQKDTNHVIAKKLVKVARDTKRSIKVEDLTHIRARTTVRGKANRAKHSNWAFAQLQAFLAYKARLHGVKLERVDPAYTSQRCFGCGHIEAANRQSQAVFRCCNCGHTAHADVNAAKNIAFWAAVNPPNVSDARVSAQVAPGTSSRL